MRLKIAALLIFLCAGYAGWQAWLAYGTSEPFTDTGPAAPQCVAIDQTSNAHRGGVLECVEKVREAALSKAAPGVAVRDGANLELFWHGRPLVRLEAVERGDLDTFACDSLTLRHVMKVSDGTPRNSGELALINCYSGEFGSRFIVLPDGQKWSVGDALASPSGRLIATGDIHSHNPSELRQWPSLKVVARFAPRCRPMDWRDDRHLDVVCESEVIPLLPGYDGAPSFLGQTIVGFDGTVSIDQEGDWQLKATHWRTGYLTPLKDGLFFPRRGFSLRCLPRMTERPVFSPSPPSFRFRAVGARGPDRPPAGTRRAS